MSEPAFVQWAEHTLGGINLLAGVGTETVIALGNKARWERHPPGTALVRAGEATTSCFALVRGSARLRYRDGRADVVAEEGATLALRMSLSDRPAWATVRTTTPALVAEIRRVDLLDATTVSPALAVNVGRMLATRGRYMAPRECLDTQIMKALAQAVDGCGSRSGETALPAPIDPALWATLLGVDRSDVRRALSRLERHRIVRQSPAGVHYVDLDRLSARLR
jgi:CRP-like cAMP-binding protein